MTSQEQQAGKTDSARSHTPRSTRWSDRKWRPESHTTSLGLWPTTLESPSSRSYWCRRHICPSDLIEKVGSRPLRLTLPNEVGADNVAHLQPLCQCSECRNHAKELASRRNAKKARRTTKRAIPILLAWAFLAYLLYGIYVAPPVFGDAPYNPFEVLGIASSSTDKQIKKHYKKLSLQL